MAENTKEWSESLIKELAFEGFREQKKTRFWNNIFKGLAFVYVLTVVWRVSGDSIKEYIVEPKDHVAVINISGAIATDKEANAKDIIETMRDVVKNEHVKGIILNANSPGGSPVQSDEIYNEIRRIKVEYKELPIYGVITDLCASGCYYILSATDKIYVNKSSIVGSIGVIMSSFGFEKTMEKVGAERRLIIAGSHKAMLDPFSPVNKDENVHFQNLLDEVHQVFIDAVKTGRGSRLIESKDLFSGLVWSGAKSIEMGLTDALGNIDSVSKDVIGIEKTKVYGHKEPLLNKMLNKIGLGVASGFLSEINSTLFSAELE